MSAASVARAGVLAALARRGSYASDIRLWCNILADTAVAVKAGEDGVAVAWTYPHRALREVVAWTVESPAHGVEVLSERGLWPWAPGDVDAPRWWCEACGGTGGVHTKSHTEFPDEWSYCDTCGREDPDVTGGVTADGTTADPLSLAALVAVASLGAETLRRVAELVRELHSITSRRVECDECRGWGGHTITTGDGSHGTLEQESCEGCGGAGKVTVCEVSDRVVWRVMTREALREHHERRRGATVRRGGEFLCATFSACVLGGTWADGEDVYGTDHRPLHALADCGVHIVSASPERVVIAVEAVYFTS